MERYIRTSTAGIANELALGANSGRSVGSVFGAICSDFTYDKDSDDVYDHLLELIVQVCGAINMPTAEMASKVEEGRLKAHAKHGENSIEAKSGDDTLFWLSCLGEEYGEMCDEADDFPRYCDEAVDLCTVATAWLAALSRLDD